MPQELQQIVIDTFKELDVLDFKSIFSKLADDVETVDEISQTWSRGRAAVEKTFESIAEAVSNIKSEVSDFNVVSAGDAAVVTCVLHQSYDYQGQSVSIVAPTTSVFRNENGTWKFVLIHSLPVA